MYWLAKFIVKLSDVGVTMCYNVLIDCMDAGRDIYCMVYQKKISSIARTIQFSNGSINMYYDPRMYLSICMGGIEYNNNWRYEPGAPLKKRFIGGTHTLDYHPDGRLLGVRIFSGQYEYKYVIKPSAGLLYRNHVLVGTVHG